MSGWASAIGAAVGSMTPAQQVLYQGMMRPGASGTTRRRKRKAGKKKAKSARRARGARKSAAPKRRRRRGSGLVKGSPAAKRRMAQLRRLRGRKRA